MAQPHVIKFTSCLSMDGGSLWVLRLFPPLKLVAIDIAEILLKVALNTKNQSINLICSEIKLAHFLFVLR